MNYRIWHIKHIFIITLKLKPHIAYDRESYKTSFWRITSIVVEWYVESTKNSIKCMYQPNPSTKSRFWHKVNFKQSKADLNSVFFFS